MTYELKTKKHFDQLSKEVQDEVLEFLSESIKDNNMVSIQLDSSYDDEGNIDNEWIYGLYANTKEWVSDYNNGGGLWEYSEPRELLAFFNYKGIETMKNEISEMSDEDLQKRFDLYNELECIDTKTNLMIELMAQELDRR